jgi:hypothetical protein
MMPGNVTQGDGKAAVEQITFADVNTVEQTSYVTPSIFFSADIAVVLF